MSDIRVEFIKKMIASTKEKISRLLLQHENCPSNKDLIDKLEILHDRLRTYEQERWDYSCSD